MGYSQPLGGLVRRKRQSARDKKTQATTEAWRQKLA